MRLQDGYLFDLADLTRGPGRAKYSENSRYALAGRCLLDAIEYLRAPWIPGRFAQVTAAHAVRMSLLCLTGLKSESGCQTKQQLKRHVSKVLQMLLSKRQDDAPMYGEDMWDWAYVIDAFVSVEGAYPDLCPDRTVVTELRSFYRCVKERLEDGLFLGSEKEWFGPATPVAAFRLLERQGSRVEKKPRRLEAVRSELKKQALTLIEDGRYLGRQATPGYYAWHYGQVVSQFPADSGVQQCKIRELDLVGRLEDSADRCYALARIIQGAAEVEDEDTVKNALSMLYHCQEKERPFGSGLLGDNVKASLNVLEALWESVAADDTSDVNEMVGALSGLHRSANTIGIVVAVQRERDACAERLKAAGARVERGEGATKVGHNRYQVVIRMGKGLLDASRAVEDLIERDGARWIVMVGIAGSLARNRGAPSGPKKGDVVLSVGLAPYRIREKNRDEVNSVPVPLLGQEWSMIPADPTLFRAAHEACADWHCEGADLYEGLIVTGNGIKDNLAEKKRVLAKWPGGLAVDEESYAVGLMAYSDKERHAVDLVAYRPGRRFIAIRGISDLAEGDKIKQQDTPGQEKVDQERAARNAADVAVRMIEKLSAEW